MSRPWMPLYVADYLADTGHLSAAEHGGYMLLIMHYWQRGGLPADERQLARIARFSADEWGQSRDTIAAFFDAEWRHARIDAELAEAKIKYEKRAAAGKAGGKAKASNATAMPEHSQSNEEALLYQPQPQPLRTEANASGDKSPDPRQQVWTEGVRTLVAIAGKTETSARSQVGKWLRDTQDDCALVLSKIRQAQTDRIGEPISWITAAVKPSGAGPPQREPRNAGERALMKLQAGIIEREPTSQSTGHLDRSDSRRQIEGPGIARQFARQTGSVAGR